MRPLRTIPEEILQQLKQLDTCTVSNAIEQFGVRTRNEGFVNGSVRCIFPDLPPKVGYAVTARVRTSSTPIAGRCYFDRLDWWSYVDTIPSPRFIVAEDVDHIPGLGALFGEIHARISKAMGCVAYLTNGSVRDLPGIRAAGVQAFATRVSVSHAYAHVIDFGDPVEVGGLRIRPGDLLHGDEHGVVLIPDSIAEEVPRAATEMLDSEKELIDFCESSDFSLQKLGEKIQRVSQKFGPG
ncbi:MAG: RraA family protein [Acidobacteriota bacterium]|nr:RraA family protein [Acidobacteriota bacterium]